MGRTVALLVIGITATTSSCAFWPFNQFTDETEPAASGDTQPGVVARAEPSPPRFDPSDACFALPITEARIDRSLPRDFQQAKRAFDRGLRLQDDGRHTEALAEFQRALDADQTFGLAHLEAAVSHMYTDHDSETMRAHLAAAVILLPQNPRAQLNFGRLLLENDDTSMAERHFGCALTLAPDLADAHEALARLFLRQTRTEEAERRARSAVALAPTETTYRVLLADILTRGERWMEAGAEVEQAARQVGRSAALYRRAADLYARAGADNDAARLRAEADIIDPPPEQRELRPLKKR